MRRPAPRLTEIAHRAGVSLAPVSGGPEREAGCERGTRRRVLDVVAEQGYADSPVRGQRTAVVGIITSELDNPVFRSLSQSIEARLARTDHLGSPVTLETVS